MSRAVWLSTFTLLAACGGAPAPAVVEPVEPPLEEAGLSTRDFLFPDSDVRELRADRWGRHIALLADSQVYGSNGDDLPTMVGGALFPMLASPSATPRCGIVGLGSSVEASGLAAFGCQTVDVYELRADVFENARPLGEWFDERLRPRGARAPFRVLDGPPAESTRYDVLVQSIGAAVIHRQHRLFLRERFERAKALIADGGIFMQHVQLYQIHAETFRRMLRTLADVFDHLVVVSPLHASSDSLVLASNAPIAFDLARLEAWSSDATARRWLQPMDLYSSYDPLARALFASRAEVLAYCGGAAPYTMEDPLPPMPQRPPHPPPEAWTSEFEAAWEERMNAFSAQFDDSFLDGFYDEQWSSGRLCPSGPAGCAAVRGVPPSADFDAFALSLIAHGRYGWTADALEACVEAGCEDGSVPLEVLRSFLDHEANVPSFDPLRPFPSGLPQEFEDAAKTAWLHWQDNPTAALSALERATIRASGPLGAQLRLATVMTALRADDAVGAERAAIDLREGYAGWCDEHPASWYWIGRALDAGYNLADATRAMVRYISERR